MSMGVVMTAIILLAFASMASSIFIADTTQGLATAINESGALRMRSYRIATNLTQIASDNNQHREEVLQLITGFENHLYNTNLTDILPDNKNKPVQLAYDRIEKQWSKSIRPLFNLYFHGQQDTPASVNAIDNLRKQYLLVVSDFVGNIDHLVSLLEENAENKIQGLRSFQVIILILTVLLTMIALLLIYQRIHKPLKQLLTSAESTRQRDFTFHIKYTGKDELGQLGSAFNAMAKDLSEIYSELEDRIKQKTTDLEQSNHSMELLYKTVNRLIEADSPRSTFTKILKDIEGISGMGQGAICMNEHQTDKASIFTSTLDEDKTKYLICNSTGCNQCLNSGIAHSRTVTDSNNHKKTYVTIPISDLSKQYGVLIIETTDYNVMTSWKLPLLESIASHIGIAIKLTHQSTESRRLALIEERGVIARELHDSLAQSLTYMKIQLSRIQAIINQKNNTDSEEATIVTEMRSGLNSAYKELRELLTTFRLKIDEEDFNDALLKTVSEFDERSSSTISCDSQIANFELTPNEEIHILQLIRESLSNIVQHSKAERAVVQLKYLPHNDIEICIIDNGKGIENISPKTHHYGLSIMKERAKTLNGQLKITNNSDGGTTVALLFTPTCKTTSFQTDKIKE